jgi:hypothetical protein
MHGIAEKYNIIQHARKYRKIDDSGSQNHQWAEFQTALLGVCLEGKLITDLGDESILLGVLVHWFPTSFLRATREFSVANCICMPCFASLRVRFLQNMSSRHLTCGCAIAHDSRW